MRTPAREFGSPFFSPLETARSQDKCVNKGGRDTHADPCDSRQRPIVRPPLNGKPSSHKSLGYARVYHVAIIAKILLAQVLLMFLF